MPTIAFVSIMTLVATASRLAQPELPERRGLVNDFAEIIRPEREAAIARIIEEVHARSGGEIVVVTMDSLAGRTAEETALRLRTTWGIGRGGRAGAPASGVGVVFLVVPARTAGDAYHVEIETGLRASAFISVQEVARITETHLVPAFRNGDYGAGILQGVAAIAVEYAERFGFELTGDPPGPSAASTPPPSATAIAAILLGGIALLGVLFFLARHRRDRPGSGTTDGSDS